MNSNSVVSQSAALRGQGKFDEAIDLIERTIDSVESSLKVNAWLEASYAAKEQGDPVRIKKYARLVAEENADVPTIQEYI